MGGGGGGVEWCPSVGVALKQCCGSGMFNPVGFPITDKSLLGSKNSNKREGGKNLLSYLFCSHKSHKIKNYINFELMKNFLANLQRIRIE